MNQSIFGIARIVSANPEFLIGTLQKSWQWFVSTLQPVSIQASKGALTYLKERTNIRLEGKTSLIGSFFSRQSQARGSLLAQGEMRGPEANPVFTSVYVQGSCSDVKAVITSRYVESIGMCPLRSAEALESKVLKCSF